MIGSNLAMDLILFLVTASATAVMTPAATRSAVRAGFIDRPAPHKFHRQPTPYLGGVVIAAAVLGALVASILLRPGLRAELVVITLGAAAVGGIGLLDDVSSVRPIWRLAVETLAAQGLWAAGIRIGATGIAPVDLCLTVLAVVAVINAVNLLDNMDGLSAGTVAIASLFFFAAASWEGQRLVSVMAIALAGACVGFLPYNFSPASIFLGDAGTLLMGFLLATTAIKLELRGYPVMTRAAVPILIIAVPLFDMALVVLSRWRGRRPVFRGGVDHTSHRLVALGATPRAAAMMTYAAEASAGGVALALLRARSEALTASIMGIVLTVGLALVWTLERVTLSTPDPSTPSASPSPVGPTRHLREPVR
jgi:UDP-GlcNAc:undecaprenyl-phosphate GlcNAc-1-phosphate transferase